MASGDKEKTSWFGRMLGRTKGGMQDEFEELELDGTFDDGTLLEDMNEEMTFEGDELFEDEEVAVPARRSGAEDLQINLVDKGDVLVAQAIVPGIEEKDIDIDLNREMLAITTGSNDHHVERDGDYLYEELTFGSFSRSILLPAEVEVEDAKAEVKDGVLTIVMPKIDKEAHRKLSVKKK